MFPKIIEFNQQDAKYLKLAYQRAAKFSTDPSVQNGAYIVEHTLAGDNVLGRGANHFPAGVKETEDRWSRENSEKYNWVEHAERNAIYDAARRTGGTEGAIMYVPWYACCDCARAIIQSGIARVVGHQMTMDLTPDRWKVNIEKAFVMLEEAGVDCVYMKGKLFRDGELQIRFNSELVTP